MTAIQHPVAHHGVTAHRAVHRAAVDHEVTSRPIGRIVDAVVGVVVALAVTALPAAWALMVLIDLAGGSLAYGAALPLGLFVGLVPLALGAAMGRTPGARPDARVVVGTGVDPVTFRFSGGRSAN